MKTVALPSGERVPALGMGTWYMGENPATRPEELATLHLGFDLGVTLVDTAEMYGDGLAEQLVGEAIEGRRDEVFLVTKILPHHADRRQASIACEGSLRRLGTDRIDLYLLHWRGEVPLAETLAAFMELQKEGKIRYYGVSNLDIDDMKELWWLPGGSNVATDQVLYNLAHRGIEWELLPWLREHRIPVMAYSPIQRAGLMDDSRLVNFAMRHGRTPAQVALAWLLAKDDVIVIPKTSHRKRLEENLGALEDPLTKAQLKELDRLFPPPKGPTPLEVL
ncbi:MAG: aldo/keto reductase family protein [Pedosphaera sp.]|nr:aldo/keto reductase family protein [Pedosphaera sp.]